MKILAFDTSSSNVCTVGLFNEGRMHTLDKILPMQQAKLILPMIQELLDASSIHLNNLDAIAFGEGPGSSFTGMRIACSVAQGLGFAAQKPLIAISSLAALAQTIYLKYGEKKALIAIDARMGQLYWASYALKDLMRLLGQERLCKPEEITSPLDSNGCGVGEGWLKYAEIIIDKIGFHPHQIYGSEPIQAEALLVLAKDKYEKGQFISLSDANPVYLR